MDNQKVKGVLTHLDEEGNPRMVDGMKELLYPDGFKDHKKREPGEIHAEEF